MEEVPDPNVLGDEPMDADPNDGDPDLSDNNGGESDGDYIDENVDDAAAVLLGSSGRVRDEDVSFFFLPRRSAREVCSVWDSAESFRLSSRRALRAEIENSQTS